MKRFTHRSGVVLLDAVVVDGSAVGVGLDVTVVGAVFILLVVGGVTVTSNPQALQDLAHMSFTRGHNFVAAQPSQSESCPWVLTHSPGRVEMVLRAVEVVEVDAVVVVLLVVVLVVVEVCAVGVEVCVVVVEDGAVVVEVGAAVVEVGTVVVEDGSSVVS